MLEWILDNLEIAAFIGIAIASAASKLFETLKGQQKSEKERDYKPLPQDWGEPARPQTPLPKISRPSPPMHAPPPLAVTVSEEAEVLQRQTVMAEKLRLAREVKANLQEADTTWDDKFNKLSAKPTEPIRQSLRKGLKSRAELRRAFIMREILDPPVALR